MPLGATALAKALGTSRQMIYQYEREGKLKRPTGGYTVDDARAQLADTLGSKRGGVPRRGGPAPVPQAHQMGCRKAMLTESEVPPEINELSKSDLERMLLAERIRRERLANDEQERILIPAGEVRAAQTERATAEREALLNWPSSGIAAELAAKFGSSERDMFLALDVEVRRYLQSRSQQPLEVSA